MRAAASTIASTVSCARAWRGILRGCVRRRLATACSLMRVARRIQEHYSFAMTYLIRRATSADVIGIERVLCANERDASLFQQPRSEIRRNLGDFFVAESDTGAIAACSALHSHGGGIFEILAVAVRPELHGAGLGSALLD